MFKRALLLTLAALSFACGPAGDSNDDENNGGGDVDYSFDCDGTTCSSDSQFCLLERFSNGNVHTRHCPALPSSCSGCDCAEDAAVDFFDGANNCDGLIACSVSNGAITIRCTAPARF